MHFGFVLCQLVIKAFFPFTVRWDSIRAIWSNVCCLDLGVSTTVGSMSLSTYIKLSFESEQRRIHTH